MPDPIDLKLAEAVAQGGKLRALVLELWQRTRMDWGFVTDRLAITFRKEKWVGSHERRFVSETLYGMVRNLRRIDVAIEHAAEKARDGVQESRGRGAPRDLERLIVLLFLDGLLDEAVARRAVPVLHWPTVAAIDEAIRGERDLVTRIGESASLPDWLATRLHADWGADAEPLALALNQRAPMTVRANTLVGTRDALAAELAQQGLATHAGQWSDTALIVDSRTNLFALDAFQRGAFEAQDEGSQLLAELAIPATPKPLIVDYCAGAGGKTLAIAARLGNRGRIIATDVDAGKLEELRKRARRAKVSNARAVPIDGDEIDALRDKADVVLVDAPCTGVGALRRNPEARWRLREDEIAGFAKRQREIVVAAAKLVAPGGTLIYATCSLLSAENADVIAALPPDLVRVPLGEVVGTERARVLGDTDALVVTPHRHGTDGFFAQVLRRA